MFNTDTYRKVISTQWLGHSLLYYDELESTNTCLKKIPADEISHGLVCLADFQTKGRGQYERNWETESGQNLTFTIAFKPGNPERLHVLTLACARAVCDVIEKETNAEAYLKWPNDLMVDHKKTGGVLTETVFSGNHLDRVLIGVGLNVNQELFSTGLKEKATSLKKVKGEPVNRELLLAETLQLMEHNYNLWHRQDMELLKKINRKLAGYGQWIKLIVNGAEQEETYKLLGMNERGELTLLNHEAELRTFSYEQIRIVPD